MLKLKTFPIRRITKMKHRFLTVMIATILFSSSVYAQICEQHDFGSSSIQYNMFGTSKTWEFTAENDMLVQELEILSVIQSSYAFATDGVLLIFPNIIKIMINDTEVADWYVQYETSTSSPGPIINSKTVNFELHQGDKITYSIKGGTAFSSSGRSFISGPNYVKLCGENGIAISPGSFRYGGDDLYIIESYYNPSIGALTHDGSNLWHSNYADDTVTKLDGSANVSDSFAAPGAGLAGVTYDGTYFWTCDDNDNIIYKLDKSGNIISSFASPSERTFLLTYDGTYLYTDGSNADEDEIIYKTDTSGNIISSFRAPDDSVVGLAHDGTYLWCSGYNSRKIYQLDMSGNIVNSFTPPGSNPGGLTYDGKYLWNYDRDTDQLYKLRFPGNVQTGLTETQTFTVSNYGSTELSIETVALSGSNSSEFSIVNDKCSGQIIPPAGKATFDLIFSPLTEGEKTATIKISSDDSSTPLREISLTGFAEGNAVNETDIDGGTVVFADLWLKSVLRTAAGDFTLIWKEVGRDSTPSGDKVVSGYFYADPAEFAYGSRYNPEVFVKIYAAANGWANIAFNHVTVDNVDIYSAHQYEGSPEQSGIVTLDSRLAEHSYTGVSADGDFTVPTDTSAASPYQDGGYILYSELWGQSVLQTATGSVPLIWKEVGNDTTPSGDRVISGYYYADPTAFAYGSPFNPELFVKVYIAANGWANIAFNHVSVDPIDVASALSYAGTPQNTDTVILENRLAEHSYTGVSLVSDPDEDEDADGYTKKQGDCNDADASVNPGADEICGDGIDQDCDGSDPECLNQTPVFDSELQNRCTSMTEYEYVPGTAIVSGTTTTWNCTLWWDATDPEGDEISYHWEILEGNGSIVSGSNSPEVRLKQVGSEKAKINVTVTDSLGSQAEKTFWF
jgi:hypothetical protein